MYQIQVILYELLAIIAGAFKDKYSDVKPRAEEMIEDTRNSMESLAKKVLDGEIKLEDVPKHLEQEYLLLKTELLETAALGISFSEEAWNTIVEKYQAVLAALLPDKEKQ